MGIKIHHGGGGHKSDRVFLGIEKPDEILAVIRTLDLLPDQVQIRGESS